MNDWQTGSPAFGKDTVHILGGAFVPSCLQWNPNYPLNSRCFAEICHAVPLKNSTCYTYMYVTLNIMFRFTNVGSCI